MGHRIEVMSEGSVDLTANGLATKTVPIRVYNIDDDNLSLEELEKMRGVFADPIVDISTIDRPVLTQLPNDSVVIEQTPNPNVTDSEGEVARELFTKMLNKEVGPISFSKQLLWIGPQTGQEFIELKKMIINPLSETRMIEASDWKPDTGVGFHHRKMELPKPKAYEYIDISGSNEDLMKLSEEKLYSFNLAEMHAIRDDLFSDENFLRDRRAAGLLEDKPTDADLEGIAQTWSEHCRHKKFNAKWIYTTEDSHDESGLAGLSVGGLTIPNEIDSVFKSIIQRSTRQIISERKIDWIKSIFEDNAGVIKLNERFNVAHKVETHNHPSGIEANGGANTGLGGVIRDPMGTGRGMCDIFSGEYGYRNSHFDAFMFLPPELQTPRRAFYSMIAGVEDYGNKMGIPTQLGNVMFDNGWFKPGVICGAKAVARAEIKGVPTHTKNIRPEYIAITIGGGVGRDGIHGATGSSSDLNSGAGESAKLEQSVQKGNPIYEKNYLEANRAMCELGMVEASQDCGAGGWNSALGELTGLLHDLEKKRYLIKERFNQVGIGSESNLEERLKACSDIVDFKKVGSPFVDELKYEIMNGDIFNLETNGKGGCVVDLTHVTEKYAGLTGAEKLISEAQERQVLVIKLSDWERAERICKHNNVDAKIIGRFNNSGYYQVKDQDTTISFLPVDFFEKSLPQMTIKAHYKPCQNIEPSIPVPENYTESLFSLVTRPNIQLYDWISTRYDHEVQGRSLTKPVVGIGRGKNDAPVLRPVHGEPEVLIESWGDNPFQSEIDGYHMGRNNVVDAIGRVIAAGGDLEKIVFNGNTLCSPPEEDSNVAAQVIRMLKGSADAEIAFGTPRISGKDSTSMKRRFKRTDNNEEVVSKARSELYMSAMAIVKDDSSIMTPDFKKTSDVIYVIGETRDELGASEYYNMNGEVGRNVPKSDFIEIKKRFEALSKAMRQNGLIHSAQYIGRGGLASALTNSSVAGDKGVDLVLDYIDDGLGRADKILYSETTGRFVVSVDITRTQEFESMMKGIYVKEIGSVMGNKRISMSYGLNDIIETDVDTLREKYKGEIRDQ